ncbi:heavy metal-associated isoprenylated plant protein 33-like [Alosa sapidissima]|uniref:heavy metal-associated isoprenylated plant protein 33-like n=1 Tax=Alosa sapidissima TaxID=34773 RepID=UPI001C08160D|nr:heavy metal-associated isoprenylated plant protein 33-like [Alosa sapidissima]
MAHFILVALLLSGVAAYPGWGQQGYGSQGGQSGGGSMRPGGGSGMQDQPSGSSGMQDQPGGGFGMQGQSGGGFGMQGQSGGGFGMQGQSGRGSGMQGQSGRGSGMQGMPSGGFGMQGQSSEGFGMQGSQSMGGGRSRPRRGNGRGRGSGSRGPSFGSMGPSFGSRGPSFGSMGPSYGPANDGDYFPGGPDMEDWDMNEAEQPWMPEGPPMGPEGEDQNDEGWFNEDDQVDGPPEFPGRGDKRAQFRQRFGGQQREMGFNGRQPNRRRPGGAGGRAPFGIKPVTPNMMDIMQFTPIVKVDNLTLPNNASLPLKEGEHMFLLPPYFLQGRQNEPQAYKFGSQSQPQLFGPQPYVKYNYNPNAAAANERITFEYGTASPLPSFLKARV